MITKSNISKYFALFYPYFALIVYNIFIYLLELCCSIFLTLEIKNSIFILINGTSIIFGFNTMKNFTHKKNCNEQSNINSNLQQN